MGVVEEPASLGGCTGDDVGGNCYTSIMRDYTLPENCSHIRIVLEKGNAVGKSFLNLIFNYFIFIDTQLFLYS